MYILQAQASIYSRVQGPGSRVQGPGSRFQGPGLESWNLPDGDQRKKRFFRGSSIKHLYGGLQSSLEMALRRLLGVPGTLSGVLGVAQNIDFV